MIHDGSLLIVGGTGRNVGKTEFVCRLIMKLSQVQKVCALKVSAVYPDETDHHGDHRNEQQDDCLSEERRRETPKDTSRMLRAGAYRVFYLRGNDEKIVNGFAEFKKLIPPDVLIICESNSLAKFVKPGLFIAVASNNGVVKERITPLLKSADIVVVSDGRSGFPELERIGVNRDNSWIITD